MLITSEWVTVLDETDKLSSMILSSEQAQKLREAYQNVYSDQLLVQKITTFTKMKEQYEDVQRFGKYHPDYNIIMKEIRKIKRELDFDERVANLKLAENDYQDLLDEISLIIGKSVSESVKVPVSNPFFATSSSCGSGCGTGGGCSCSA
ncbi:YlbF family regulator [Ureibacillus manganicus]|uniref:Regulator n=1 Tax=Ureibacillus manganicus DSM 26584 TaxID=1384049 RepID=A0A0A3IAF9_9BACL|nr:YlbF family regulator [Ureibacillus manganicus]KGR80465.1 regulator [Ureibacillus manganicus DSM 26584]